MKDIYLRNGHKGRILGFGVYKDHKWTILSLGSHPTAYVEDKIEVEDYNDERLSSIEVHGGFTFCDTPYWADEQTIYLGWDYAHFSDFYCGFIIHEGKKWTYEEILADVYSVIDQLVELEEKLKKGE